MYDWSYLLFYVLWSFVEHDIVQRMNLLCFVSVYCFRSLCVTLAVVFRPQSLGVDDTGSVPDLYR